MMYTVDIDPKVVSIGPHHKIIIKNASELSCMDVNNCDTNSPLGLVFFDCHDYDVQMHVYNTLFKSNTITNSTVIVLHDTGVWPLPFATSSCYHGRRWKDGPGYLHQVPERMMVNRFIDLGYHCVNLFPSNVDMFVELPDNLQFRHGVSICQRNTILSNDVYEDRSDIVSRYSVVVATADDDDDHDNIWNLALPERYDSMEREAFLRAFCSDHSIGAELCSYLLDRLLTNTKEGEVL